MQGDDIQAVEQVFTETAIAHHVFQVQVGGCEDAHVSAAGDRVAHALILFVLDKPQQLGLQREGEIADLVEKQRTAVRLIHSAQGAFTGAGECAAAMAEQFAFHQFGGQ